MYDNDTSCVFLSCRVNQGLLVLHGFDVRRRRCLVVDSVVRPGGSLAVSRVACAYVRRGYHKRKRQAEVEVTCCA